MIAILCCFLLSPQAAFTDEGVYHISSASDLIYFSKNVSAGTSFEGTTVFLDADVDFSGGLSEQLEPIGKNNSFSFQGTFDGQGHTINNLTMRSSSQNIGLFGYPSGVTIRNVVFDSSCSVVSSYTSLNAYAGGIIGMCNSCTVESTVNMANVSFMVNLPGHTLVELLVIFMHQIEMKPL